MSSLEAPLCGVRAVHNVAFGDPVLDIVVHVPYETLEKLNAEAGGCVPIQPSELEALLSLPEVQAGRPQRVPGGSAANVAKGLSALAQGDSNRRATRFVGMVGRDAAGAEYREKLVGQGVAPVLLESESGAATATCLCLVTPDGQRTMRTCLGAALELASPAQLPTRELAAAGHLHCEGYCLYRPAVAAAAMRCARGGGATVSLDLASFEVVRNCWPTLEALLAEQLVDVVFGNESEAEALCEVAGLRAGDGPEGAVEAAAARLLQHCAVSVFSRGAEGCVVRSAGGEAARAPASDVAIVDTVGAGDCFTAGFLHAWLHGAGLAACAACGCAAGTAAVQVAGAELGAEALQRLRERVAGLLLAGAEAVD